MIRKVLRLGEKNLFDKMRSKVDKAEMFSGKSDGISFEKLDEKVLSWGRSKYGDKYATLLWKDELTDLNKLDLSDELDSFEYEMHCTMVYDVMCYESAKYADGLFDTARFWTIPFQLQTRQRFREKFFCYLETIVKGEAARQIKKQGVRKMSKMRDFLFKRFGAGQPEVLEERVRKYHLGLPDPKTGEAFPPRCDMEAKLDALEAEREYLVEMCPKEQRESYEDGKESALVRIILRTRPKEYDSAVKFVMDLHRFRLYAKEGDLGRITNLEDNSRVIYNAADWLPNYDELRAALLESYLLQKRRRDEENKSTKKSPGHPTLSILQGFEQPGSKPKMCYGCGEPGHFRGDAECKAGANDVWMPGEKSGSTSTQSPTFIRANSPCSSASVLRFECNMCVTGPCKPCRCSKKADLHRLSYETANTAAFTCLFSFVLAVLLNLLTTSSLSLEDIEAICCPLLSPPPDHCGRSSSSTSAACVGWTQHPLMRSGR